METESGIVTPSFSQGSDGGFEPSDFGMDDFPDEDDFPMDDDYENTEPGDGVENVKKPAFHTGTYSVGNNSQQDPNVMAVPPPTNISSYPTNQFGNIKTAAGFGPDEANFEFDDYPMDNSYDEPFDQNSDFSYDTASQQQYGSVSETTAGPSDITQARESSYPPAGEFSEQYEPEDQGDEDYEEEEEDEEEDDEDDDDDDAESDGDESDEESEDEDVNEALNSLADFDNDMGLEGEDEGSEVQESSEVGGPSSGAGDGPSVGEQTTEDNSDKPEKKKRKRKKKGEAGEDTGEKRKRKRKKKGEKDEDGEKKKADKGARKNIRKILSENKLEKETLDAQNAELERQRRLQELKKQQLASLLRISPEKEIKKEKDSQLKSLLQAAEEDAEKETTESEKLLEKMKMEKAKEEKKDLKPKKEGVIDISSAEDDDDDDVVMVNDEEEEDMSDEDYAEAEDVNNSGSHINDMYNVPDAQGRVLVNVGHPTADPDIYLSPLVAKHIKPHQIGGVRFLYDNLVECVNRFKTSAGFGCILAHSMGLGKTIQMIGFIDIFLRHTGARTVMVIVPINTLANWMSEFNMWVPDKETCEKYNIPPEETQPRPYQIYLLNDNYKNTPARAKVVDDWYKSGGVLLLGYEMYRLLSSKKVHLQKASKGRKKAPGSSVIDVEEEDRDKKLLLNIHEALVNPGPDLVVCDEGHRIKNSHAGISQSLKMIRTKRRIVLTGYPLQNNLIEYWCMVDFVRPNFLGTKTEFCNMFERPIMNGQCADSTPQDVRLMRYRAHVLHSLLEGFVQRRGHTVLQAALPPKEEYVFLIRMSPIQQKLYEKFMESITDQSANGWVNNNPLKAFSVCCKIWNHPDILFTCMKKSLDDNDLDIETGEPKKKGGRGKSKKETPPATPNPEGAPSPGAVPGPLGQGPSVNIGRPNEPCITYDWANEILKDYEPGLLDHGGKIEILFNLIEESLSVEDKILIFSQSLFTLNLIEEFLSKRKVPRPEQDEYWCRNKNYFRLDGSTSSSDREKLINQFNTESNKWLFLLSTRAGSLGINLVAANRVVVIDASWNPCHDCQAICRVYRFGQVKPSFIYRMVTENTMERKIYDRQVNKQGMSDRVVDELNPQNQFRREHVDKLMYHENKEYPVVDFSNMEEECVDTVMINVLRKQGHWLTAKPFTHESLLIDRKELKLTMKEKRLAKQSYVMEKRLNVSYSRPSYAAYYPRGGQPYQGTIRGRGGIQRPIASVKPMVSTPVPMRPKIVAAPQILKPGVSVHQVLTTTEIVLPGTNTTTEAGTTEPKKIPAGQQVLVIRTPKGVYIRTPDGKIFAVRSKPQPDSTSPLDTLANTGSNLTTGGVTIVRPTTTTTVTVGASTSKLPAGVTVIRPKSSVITTTKPLTIIRQGPGQIRTIIPVTIGAKTSTVVGSTTAGQIATISAQSQKIGATLSTGSKIRIVTPNTVTTNTTGTKVSSLAALQNISEGKKIISNSPAFSGGNTVVQKIEPKPQALMMNVKIPVTTATSASSAISKEVNADKRPDLNTETKMETNVPNTTPSVVNKEFSWNLPPIDMKTLKIPQQLSGAQKSDLKIPQQLSGAQKSDNAKPEQTQVKPTQKKKRVSKVVKPDAAGQAREAQTVKNVKPKFSLSESPSDSNQSGSQSPSSETINAGNFPTVSSTGDGMSTRPSEIDLHEMKLTSNPNSVNDLSQMRLSGNKKPTQSGWQTSTVSQSTLLSSNIPNQSANKASVSRSNNSIFNPGLPNTSQTSEIRTSAPEMSQNLNTSQAPKFTNNQGMFGDSSNMGFMQGNNRNVATSFGNQNTNFQNYGSQLPNFGNQAGGLGNLSTESSGFGNQDSVFSTNLQHNSDSMGDFTMSGIHNNSSFLSELTDADDNFLSQLEEGSDQTGQQNNPLTSAGTTQNSAMLGGNLQSASMGMPAYQQGGMNFDMFSNQQQQNFFPNFGGASNQFNRNNSFGNQHNMSQQGGFMGGSMYPMGGMMQPGMFPYPAFAPYPYAPMMAPMPYYPMPFQPQYGGQGASMGQQGGNQMTQSPGMNMGMPMGQQGDGSFQSGMGN